MIELLGFLLLLSVLSPFWLRNVGLARTFLMLGFGAAFVFAIQQLFPLISGTGLETRQESLSWIPSLGVQLDFRLDALSAVFMLLVCGLGFFIQSFASFYFKKITEFQKYLFPILLFLMAMLGTLFSDNLMVLFMFWELTSLSSFFLIGYDRENTEARESAWTALLVTGLGGLSLLAGLLILGEAYGSYSLSYILAATPASGSALEWAGFFILLGAFTKSAQIPFGFWLPGAMAAPAPVSAYLHSATLVKMGVYLVARLNPIFSETPLWSTTLVMVGSLTLAWGGFAAYTEALFKKVLAYTTLSALGLMMLLVGINTPESHQAFFLVVLAHGFYKAPLFLLAGLVEKISSLKDLRKISSLSKWAPELAWPLVVSALSMWGLIPTFGFVAKEAVLASWQRGDLEGLWILVAGTGLVLGGAVAVRLLYVALEQNKSNIKKDSSIDSTVDSFTWKLLVGPVLALAIVSIVGGLGVSRIQVFSNDFVQVMSGVGSAEKLTPLHVWHGFNFLFLLSMGMLGLSWGLHLWRRQWGAFALSESTPFDGAQIFRGILKGLLNFGFSVNRFLQSGSLSRYVSWVALVWIFFAAWVLGWGDFPWGELRAGDLYFYEAIWGVTLLASVFVVLRTAKSLVALLFLGVVGYLVAVLFAYYGAPDLALTQLSIESLALLIFVLLLPEMPPLKNWTSMWRRRFDVLLSVTLGALMFLTCYLVISTPTSSLLSPFFRATSLIEAQGRNVVNVIIVDFRALDTMGEITVLVIAALGVSSLIYWRRQEKV